MNKYKYAFVVHSRWSDDEKPTATVIRSSDGWRWHDLCVTDPDQAEEICEALEISGGLKDILEAGYALEGFIRYRMSHDNWTTSDRDAASEVLDLWSKALK